MSVGGLFQAANVAERKQTPEGLVPGLLVGFARHRGHVVRSHGAGKPDFGVCAHTLRQVCLPGAVERFLEALHSPFNTTEVPEGNLLATNSRMSVGRDVWSPMTSGMSAKLP